VSARQCAIDEAAEISAFAKRGIPKRLKVEGGPSRMIKRFPPMRLHTVGDCATEENARIVSAATDEYIAAFRQQEGFSMLSDRQDVAPMPKLARENKHGLVKGASPVWSYTHAWRDIPREAWGEMSIIASCNTTREVVEAAERGYYVTSLVVPYFSQLFGVEGPRYTCNPYQGMQIPMGRKRGVGRYVLNEHVCPAQVYDHVSCSNCQLCWREPDWASKSREEHRANSARVNLHVILLEVHGVEEDSAAEIAAGALESSDPRQISGWEY
jgi:hypothetical protein